MDLLWRDNESKSFPLPDGYVVEWNESDPLLHAPSIYRLGISISLLEMFGRFYMGDMAAARTIQHIIAKSYAMWPLSESAYAISHYEYLTQIVVCRVLGNVINELYFDDSRSGDKAMRGQDAPYLDLELLNENFLKALWKMSGKAVGSFKKEGGKGLVYNSGESNDFQNFYINKQNAVDGDGEFNPVYKASQTDIDEEIDVRNQAKAKFKAVFIELTELNKTYIKNTEESVLNNVKKNYDIKLIKLREAQNNIGRKLIKLRGNQVSTEKEENEVAKIYRQIEKLELDRENLEVRPYEKEEMAEILFHSFRRGIGSRKNKIWRYFSPLHLEARIVIFILHDIAQYEREEIPGIIEKLGYVSSRGIPFAKNSISSNAAKVRKYLIDKI